MSNDIFQKKCNIYIVTSLLEDANDKILVFEPAGVSFTTYQVHLLGRLEK